jgi:hypothetical protein
MRPVVSIGRGIGIAAFFPRSRFPPSAQFAVTAPQVTKINQAVKDCLQRCYREESPFSAIGKYLEQLRKQPGWTDADIFLVESTALRMFKEMVDSPSEGMGDESPNWSGDDQS